MKFKVLIIILCLSIVGLTYYVFPMKVSKEKMKIKCNYMAYACGDCFAQYRVNEILEGGNESVNQIIHTDLVMKFKDTRMEKKIDSSTSKCVICYDFYFTGYLKKSRSKGMFFFVELADYKLKNASCCQEK